MIQENFRFSLRWPMSLITGRETAGKQYEKGLRCNEDDHWLQEEQQAATAQQMLVWRRQTSLTPFTKGLIVLPLQPESPLFLQQLSLHHDHQWQIISHLHIVYHHHQHPQHSPPTFTVDQNHCYVSPFGPCLTVSSQMLMFCPFYLFSSLWVGL